MQDATSKQVAAPVRWDFKTGGSTFKTGGSTWKMRLQNRWQHKHWSQKRHLQSRWWLVQDGAIFRRQWTHDRWQYTHTSQKCNSALKTGSATSTLAWSATYRWEEALRGENQPKIYMWAHKPPVWPDLLLQLSCTVWGNVFFFVTKIYHVSSVLMEWTGMQTLRYKTILAAIFMWEKIGCVVQFQTEFVNMYSRIQRWMDLHA